MKILFVSHSATVAGAEKVLLNLASELQKNHEVIVMIPGEGAFESEASAAGISVLIEEYGWFFPWQWRDIDEMIYQIANDSRRLASILSACKPDLVICNTGTLVNFQLAAWMIGVPCVAYLHGIFIKEMVAKCNFEVFRIIEYIGLFLSDLVIVPSAWTKKYFEDKYGAINNMHIVHNGTFVPDEIKATMLEQQCPMFVQLCTIEPNKNVNTFIDAANRVIKKGYMAKFNVYGDGNINYIKELRRTIKKQKLEPYFQIHSRTNDTSSIYFQSRAVVIMSNIESFSMVAIEAMAHSRAVIATRCGGPEEIVVDGHTGYLINKQDAETLSDKIIELISEVGVATKLGKAGRERCEELFLVKKQADKLIDLAGTVKECSHKSENQINIVSKIFSALVKKPELTNLQYPVTLNSQVRSAASNFIALDRNLNDESMALEKAIGINNALKLINDEYMVGISYFDKRSQVLAEYSYLKGKKMDDLEYQIYQPTAKGEMVGVLTAFVVDGRANGWITLSLYGINGNLLCCKELLACGVISGYPFALIFDESIVIHNNDQVICYSLSYRPSANEKDVSIYMYHVSTGGSINAHQGWPYLCPIFKR